MCLNTVGNSSVTIANRNGFVALTRKINTQSKRCCHAQPRDTNYRSPSKRLYSSSTFHLNLLAGIVTMLMKKDVNVHHWLGVLLRRPSAFRPITSFPIGYLAPSLEGGSEGRLGPKPAYHVRFPPYFSGTLLAKDDEHTAG
jgi:hypothetical protein